MMIRVSVIGATGYTGGELIRYLLKHPDATIMHCTSESVPGKSVSDVHSDLYGKCDLIFEKCNPAKIAKDSDLVFLCLPHGKSAQMAKQFLDQKIKVIDLSADFRLKSSKSYKTWYKIEHPVPQLLKKSVYGLPEIYRDEIAKVDLVANPGCYATATILAALPLICGGKIKQDSIVVDAKSGVSGAGKKMDSRYLFCESHENFIAYAVAQHRHCPEIEQELSSASSSVNSIKITFVPHLLPVNRGILVTLYADLKKKISNSLLRQLYAEFYKGEPFIHVLPEGFFPEIKSVQNTNFCHIGVKADERNQRVVIVSVIDNLGKGASSQAIQNMNLMFQLDETKGLI